MSCLGGIVSAICGETKAQPLVFVPSPERTRAEAASKLMSNREKVALDIINPGPSGIKGGNLTQLNLKRVDRQHQASVDKMLTAVCGRLTGERVSGPSTPEEALVWMQAAKFLSSRIQAEGCEKPGREPDMSPAHAEAMRTALGQIEAGSKMMSNREKIVKDITNPGKRGVNGGQLSQLHLKRMDKQHEASVDAMVTEVIGRLYGTVTYSGQWGIGVSDMKVWAEAVSFLNARIQGPEDWKENETHHENRPSDMSSHAAKALRTLLGQLEAVLMLMSNREKVALDITNPGPSGVNGGDLTQLDLKRVDRQHQASVDKMLMAVCGRLLGKGVSGPSTPEEALVWIQAATFFSKRIQQSGGQMPGRAPDMSSHAATAMRTALRDIEASSKLMSNREKVVKDITNAGPTGVNGGNLTQLDLKRVDKQHEASVDAMVQEVCSRLLGNKTSEPSSSLQVQVWAEAATLLSGRIQQSASACPGRAPDMSSAAAKAMNMVLAQITDMSPAATRLAIQSN